MSLVETEKSFATETIEICLDRLFDLWCVSLFAKDLMADWLTHLFAQTGNGLLCPMIQKLVCPFCLALSALLRTYYLRELNARTARWNSVKYFAKAAAGENSRKSTKLI